VRNISAHHSRLWNNNYTVRPRINDVIFKDKFLLEKNNSNLEVISNYYNVALIIAKLLESINRELCWLDDLEKLFGEFFDIPKDKMGFMDNWMDNFKQ
jgi:abortive infection bacteriophage resistance protein